MTLILGRLYTMCNYTYYTYLMNNINLYAWKTLMLINTILSSETKVTLHFLNFFVSNLFLCLNESINRYEQHTLLESICDCYSIDHLFWRAIQIFRKRLFMLQISSKLLSSQSVHFWAIAHIDTLYIIIHYLFIYTHTQPSNASHTCTIGHQQ